MKVYKGFPGRMKKFLRHFRQHQGISLVEVLISLAIFSVGTLGIAPMFLYASQQMRLQDDKDAAYRVAVSRLEWIDSLTVEEIDQSAFTSCFDSSGALRTFETGSGDMDTQPGGRGKFYFVCYDIDEGEKEASMVDWGEDPNALEEFDYYLKRYTVFVFWYGSGGAPQYVSLSKYRIRNDG